MGVSRDQIELPTPKRINLRQAALWAGPQLLPLELRFEELEKYPQSVENLPGMANGLEDDFENDIEEGKRKIAEVLMLGILAAEGRRGFEEAGAASDLEVDEDIDFAYTTKCAAIAYEPSFNPIPAEVWRVHAIDWDRSSLRLGRCGGGDAVEYGDVRILTRDLLRVFPDPRVPQAKPSPASRRRGRPVLYDPQRFWPLCALEIAVNGVPMQKAEFHRRMSTLWSDVIGEPVPERGWFAARYDELEKMRADFERAQKESRGD